MLQLTGRPEPPWLLLVHQLPRRPSHVRVGTWRRLQQVGAVAVRNAVYALPNTPQAREDFEWVRSEIAALGGQASVFTASSVERHADREIVRLFVEARREDYARLSAQVERLAGSVRGRSLAGPRRRALLRAGRRLREQLDRTAALDFFDAGGRAAVTAALARLDSQLAARVARAPRAAAMPAGHLRPAAFQHRVWVTRPRPGVDRMASAWLIRRFIDRHARFRFAESIDRVPASQIPFDMFGAEFGHHGECCTFETLVARFALGDVAVGRIARIVHHLDLKTVRDAPAEAAGLRASIEGLQDRFTRDDELLEQGIVLHDALYRAFVTRARPMRAGRAAAGRAVR